MARDLGVVPKKSSVRRQILALAILLVAAIAWAVVRKPSSPAKATVWNNLRQSIAGRAQVQLFDDFQHGLDSWESDENLANWSYDLAGLVIPSKLSLLTPSLSLTDYDVDCVAQVVNKGFGLVFRATSRSTYQAVKFLSEDSRPMTSMMVERYTVMDGHESARARVRCPTRFQADTLYQIHLQARGDSFTLYIQGQLVDSWADSRLPSGGLGLFCTNGERARIAWVRVSHNTDTTGKLCAFVSSLL